MKSIGIALIVVAVLCTLAVPAHADTIYSNLGAGSSYDATNAFGIQGGTNINGIDIAAPFTVAAGPGFDLTQIDIALTLGNSFNSTYSYTVQLMSDSAGSPGTSFHSWTITNVPDFSGLNSTIQPSQTISGITGISLSGGTTYWLAAFPNCACSLDGDWNTNTTSASSLVATSFDSGATWHVTTDVTPAFDVLGTPLATGPVPEPSSLLLLGTGLLGLMGMTLLRKRLA